MKTLRVTLADIAGPTGAPNSTATVHARYVDPSGRGRDVHLTDGTIVVPVRRTVAPGATPQHFDFDVYANDAPPVREVDYGHLVEVSWTVVAPTGAKTSGVRRVAITDDTPGVVQLGLLSTPTPVPPYTGGYVTPETYAELVARMDAFEVGGPVWSVNGENGVVTLDAADVGADPAGTAAGLVGALTTSIADFAKPIVVATDKTADAAVAINAQISLLSTFGGGTVTIPAGSIRLDTPIIPKNNVRVRGLGAGLTVLYPRQEGFTYTTGSTSTPLTNFHISDLTIDGTDRTGTYKGYHGQFHVNCSWTNLIIQNTGMTGLGPDKLRQCLISNVTTIDTGLDNNGTQPSGNGIGIGAGGWTDHESFSIVNCNAIRAKRYGIMVEGSDSVSGAKIIGNFATECGSAGFGLGCGYGVIAQGNIAYANTGNGIELSNLTLASAPATGYAIVSGNWVYKNVGHGISYRVDVHRANNGGVQIVDNAIRLNTGNGIDVAIDLSMPNSLEQVAGFKIDRNVIAVNTGTGINLSFTGTSGSGYLPTGWTIDENTFYRDNIRLAGNMKGSSISRNVFALSAVGEDGIYLGYGGAATTLTSCIVTGNLYTGDGPTKVAVNIDPAVTLTKTRVFNNLPDSAADITNIAANYTAKLSDRTIVSDGGTTIYVPQPAAARAGAELTVKNINAANVTLAFTPPGPTIDGATTLVLPQWGTADLVCTGTQWLKK